MGGREIAMKRPSPLSTKLYKKGGMRKIACLFHNGGEWDLAIVHSCARTLKHPDSHSNTGHYPLAQRHTLEKGISPSYTGHLMRNDHC